VFSSVRVRLTLWYLLVFGVLLTGFSLSIYFVLSNDVYARLDRSLSKAARMTATLFQAETGETGGDAVSGAAEVLSELRQPDVYVAIYEGERLLASDYPNGEQPLMSGELLSLAQAADQPAFKTVRGFGEEGARQALLSVKAQDHQYYVVIAEPLHSYIEQLESITRIFCFAVPAALLVAGLGGFLVARKSLAPVVAMSDQAERMSAKNLQERLDVRNPNDELGRLASVLNGLLSRLDRSFESMRSFTADAAHELRTPLSIIRGEADVALSQDRDATEYKEALAIIQDEARRLSRLVDDMLALARADAGQRPLEIKELYLNDLAEECCRAAQVLALQKGLSLSQQPSSDIPFRGDEDLLRRMMLNLLDNAIKYTPPGGVVSLAVIEEEASIRIVVTDTGIGIPPEAALRIFERFYRVGKARSRVDGGSGLGLAIAKWAAEAHNGTINYTSRPGEGSTFVVGLPSSRR
jgi:heavy metal sensor kinase